MTTTSSQSQPFIVFRVEDTTFGVPSHAVQQIEMVEQITSVPGTAPFVDGIAYSRGQVIPVINLRTLFGLPKVALELRTRLVVVRVEDRTVGLLVDSAREFLPIPNESIQPPPQTLSGPHSHYLSGIGMLGDRVLLILDVSKVLSESTALAQAADADYTREVQS